MPKNVFWPATLVIMGFIFLASNIGMLPREFWNFWPLILIVVGLGGLLTSDREEWIVETKKSQAKSKPKHKKSATRKKKK
ncbi:hypothetical protein KJ707_02465 [Patescibacteria group bacterium]|nr:hypothetical protein [Patescibacteria group bacterium]MBU1966963.1 hypothetical protein [Patescibacteria group bacterium]MBU2543400.1 hypothetical protein [Patescibacteria group bacterium]